MIARLDGFRDMLKDLGGGLGVNDPVSDVRWSSKHALVVRMDVATEPVSLIRGR